MFDTIQCLMLIIMRNKDKRCLQWRLFFQLHDDAPLNFQNLYLLERIHERLYPILLAEKELESAQCQTLPLTDPTPEFMLSRYVVRSYDRPQDEYQAVFSTAWGANPADFGILRIPPLGSSLSSRDLYFLLKIVLRYYSNNVFEMAGPRATPSIWDLLFNRIDTDDLSNRYLHHTKHDTSDYEGSDGDA